MVVLSKELNKKFNISVRISSRLVFCRITCRFSRMVTVAWTVFGAANKPLKTGKIISSYSSSVDSWMSTRIGWRTAASESCVLRSGCSDTQMCCNHSFWNNLNGGPINYPVRLGRAWKINRDHSPGEYTGEYPSKSSDRSCSSAAHPSY